MQISKTFSIDLYRIMHLSRSEVSELVFGRNFAKKNKVAVSHDELLLLKRSDSTWTNKYMSKLSNISSVDQLKTFSLVTPQGHKISGGLGGLHSKNITV